MRYSNSDNEFNRADRDLSNQSDIHRGQSSKTYLQNENGYKRSVEMPSKNTEIL